MLYQYWSNYTQKNTLTRLFLLSHSQKIIVNKWLLHPVWYIYSKTQHLDYFWYLSYFKTDKESAENLSKLVNDACSLLADYNSRLSKELEDRQQTFKMFHNYRLGQKLELKSAEEKLEVIEQ